MSKTFRMTENQPLANKEDCRGGCYVGRVNSEAQLALMGHLLEKVEVFQNIPVWNSHDWVEAALRTLRNSGFFIHGKKSTIYGCLQDIMICELESWLGVTYAVRFVGFEYLECVLHSRRRYLERREELARRGVRVWRMKG
ncbi:hypothetical protein BDR07DRAFT_1435936 [Suillus spraguei]|nr:hypothetical protein BDR07DRAFT_1435936 [Suillus spraguei]